MSLLCQLWSLHESIQEYKGSCQEAGPGSDAMDNGFFDEDDEFYTDSGVTPTETPDESEVSPARNGTSEDTWLHESFRIAIWEYKASFPPDEIRGGAVTLLRFFFTRQQTLKKKSKYKPILFIKYIIRYIAIFGPFRIFIGIYMRGRGRCISIVFTRMLKLCSEALVSKSNSDQMQWSTSGRNPAERFQVKSGSWGDVNKQCWNEETLPVVHQYICLFNPGFNPVARGLASGSAPLWNLTLRPSLLG